MGMVVTIMLYRNIKILLIILLCPWILTYDYRVGYAKSYTYSIQKAACRAAKAKIR